MPNLIFSKEKKEKEKKKCFKASSVAAINALRVNFCSLRGRSTYCNMVDTVVVACSIISLIAVTVEAVVFNVSSYICKYSSFIIIFCV